MTSNCPCSVQYSTECGIHGLACWKGRRNIGFQYYNIAFSPKFFYVLAANTTWH